MSGNYIFGQCYIHVQIDVTR